MKILCVIPARGGSKGIPRKNLRILRGKPLIHYAIENALNSSYSPDVVVSSDDEEILAHARRLGVSLHERDERSAADATTLDPVIHQACLAMEERNGMTYDLVVTLQPTSPLLKTSTIDTGLERMSRIPSIDTLISACDATHLYWKKEDGRFVPDFEERLNRQYLTPRYQETGGFMMTRRKALKKDSRIGNEVDLFILEGGERVDIDDPLDWNLCDFLLSRKRLLFIVTGNERVGLGHVHNTLNLADEILDHEVLFLVDHDSRMAYERIASTNHEVHFPRTDHSLLDEALDLNPDVVINDILDTEAGYVEDLKKAGCTVINFEDLGSGAKKADLVINAMYPEDRKLSGHYFGHKYFCLKNEFLLENPISIQERIQRVLLSFGGVDPNDLTRKVLEAIYRECSEKGIIIDIVTGFGYPEERKEYLRSFNEHVVLHENVQSMVDRYKAVDLLFTSAGRTTFEAAALGLPAIVLAQNDRELTHFFSKADFGFQNLGSGREVSQQRILETFQKMEQKEERERASRLMIQSDIRKGKERVLALIKERTKQ